MTQLRAALATSNEQVRKSLYEGLVYGLRYENYPLALDGLEQIIQDPSLTESQKKLADEVLVMLKEKAQIATNSPASR